MIGLTPLGSLLERGDLDNVDGFLYVKRDTDITPATLCMVIDSEEPDLTWDEQMDMPAIAVENDLYQACEIRDLEDISFNLSQQKPDYGLTDLVEALSYFLANDAFLKVEN